MFNFSVRYAPKTNYSLLKCDVVHVPVILKILKLLNALKTLL
jgi:hypothetical protein